MDIYDAWALDPRNKEVFCIRARIRFRLKDFNGAMEDATQALRLPPATAHDRAAFRTRGEAKLACGDHHGAMADFGTVEVQIPADPVQSAAFSNAMKPGMPQPTSYEYVIV